MSQPSHQTVRLRAGKHCGAEDGVCVMELASMLEGRQFTDTPESVCPVIRDFLRSYNDRIDDVRRQDLYACAAAVVGSRSTACVERERLWLCVEAARSARPDWRAFPTFPVLPLRRRAAFRAGWALAGGPESDHARALALVDELLEVGREARDELEGTGQEVGYPEPSGGRGPSYQEEPRTEVGPTDPRLSLTGS